MSISKYELEEWVEQATQKQLRHFAIMLVNQLTDKQIKPLDRFFSKKISFSISEPNEKKSAAKSPLNESDDDSPKGMTMDDNLFGDVMSDIEPINTDSLDDAEITPEMAEQEFDEVVNRKPIDDT